MILLCDGTRSFGKRTAYGHNRLYRKFVFGKLRQEKPDLILSTLSQGPSLWAAEYAMLHKVPLIVCLPCKEWPNDNCDSYVRTLSNKAKKYARQIMYADREFVEELIDMKGYKAGLDVFSSWKLRYAWLGLMRMVPEDLLPQVKLLDFHTLPHTSVHLVNPLTNSGCGYLINIETFYLSLDSTGQVVCKITDNDLPF